MKYLLIILLIVSAGCARKGCPESSNKTFDSSAITVTETYKDTVVTVPGKSVGTEFNLFDLLKLFNNSLSEPTVKVDTTAVDLVIHTTSKVNENLTATVEVMQSGKVKVTCKEDSLRLLVTWLWQKNTELYKQKNTVQVIAVPGATVTKTVWPNFLWYLLAFNIIYFGLKIVAAFYMPASGILKTVLSLIKRI